MSNEIKEEVKKVPLEFSKAQLANSERYKQYKDVITALLEDDKRYTIKQADAIINDYLKRSVK